VCSGLSGDVVVVFLVLVHGLYILLSTREVVQTLVLGVLTCTLLLELVRMLATVGTQALLDPGELLFCQVLLLLGLLLLVAAGVMKWDLSDL
jgi:hypothetical protein